MPPFKQRHTVLVPYGLKTWLECVSRAAVQEFPDCLGGFIANYCKELLEYRDENPTMDIRILVCMYQRSRENRRSLRKRYAVGYSKFGCLCCMTLPSSDAYNIPTVVQMTGQTDEMCQSVFVQTSTTKCHSKDVSKASGLCMSPSLVKSGNEKLSSASTSEVILDVVVHSKVPTLVPTPNMSRAPSGDLQEQNVAKKELSCQATDKSTCQQSIEILLSPTKELCSIVPCSNEVSGVSAVVDVHVSDTLMENEQFLDGQFVIAAQRVSLVADGYLTETLVEYDQFSETELVIATQQMSEVSMHEITSTEESVSEDGYGSPKLSPLSSSESAVRVTSPAQRAESHSLRGHICEITVRASAEQLDLTSSCMLYRSSSEEEESATVLERSLRQTVLRTVSQEERMQMKISSVSGGTDKILDDGDGDADVVVLYEVPSNEWIASSEESEDGVCASGNNLSSTPPPAVTELLNVSGDVNMPNEEDVIVITRDIPLRLSRESVNLTSSWSQARLHSCSKSKDVSILSSLIRRSHTTASKDRVEGSSRFSEDHLSSVACTESSITILFEDSDEDVSACECESIAVAESIADYDSIPEVVIIHKALSLEELSETDLKTDEEDLCRSDSPSAAKQSQGSVMSPKMPAEESDTAPHVTVIYKASSGEDLSEVNITSNDESVGSDSNLKWVPSTNERGSTSETQAVNERHESVSSLANKSPRLSPQHSKRELLVSGLNKTSSASREELCEAQLSDDIEKNLPELISLHEESLTNIKSEKDYVGTTDSTERFRASPEPSCTSEVSEKPGLILDVINIQNASSEEELSVVVDHTCSRDLVSSLLKEDACKLQPGAESIALNTLCRCLDATTSTGQEMFDLPYETGTAVATAEKAPAVENVVGSVKLLISRESLQISVSKSCDKFSSNGDIALQTGLSTLQDSSVSMLKFAAECKCMCCVSPYVATMEKDPTTKILSEDTMSAEENPPESESVLVKVLSATSQGSGSDTAMMAQLETAAEQYTFTTTPSQEGRTWGKSQELSPQTDVSGRERSDHTQVSTTVSEPQSSIQEIPFEDGLNASKCIGHDNLEKESGKTMASRASPLLAQNERLNKMVDGTLEMRMASSKPSAETIQFSSISKDAEEAENTPDVMIIQKAPSREELPDSRVTFPTSKSLGDDTGLSTSDTVDVQNTGIDMAVEDLPESAEQCIAHIRTPSEDKISTDISVVIIRSPRLSPRHSSGDVSENASAEHLQMSTTGLVSAPTVPAEDVSEPSLIIEEVVVEKTLDVVKFSSHVNLEKKPSELKSKKAYAAVTSIDSSSETQFNGTDKPNEIPDEATLKVALTSPQPSSESIQPPFMLKEQMVANIKTCTQDEISAGISVVKIGFPRLSPCHSSGHVSVRAFTEHLHVSSPATSTQDVSQTLNFEEITVDKASEEIKYPRHVNLEKKSSELIAQRASLATAIGDVTEKAHTEHPQVSFPTVSTKDVSEMQLNVQQVSQDSALNEATCSNHASLEKTHSELTRNEESSDSTPSANSTKIPFDGNTEVNMALIQSSSERIHPSCISKAVEVAEHIPYVTTIHKAPSKVKLAEIGSPSSLGRVGLSDNDGLLVEESGSTTAVVAPRELTEQRIAYIRTPSQDEICTEVSAVKIRSPRLSPLHLSQEFLQASTSGLISTPTIPAVFSEVLLGGGSVSSEKTSEAVKVEENIPHVGIIHKTPSGAECTETSSLVTSSSSLGHIDLSDPDGLDIQMSANGTTVAAPLELAEQRVAYLGAPSQEEISAEVTVMRIRPPRLSPSHSTRDVSESASTEHLQVSTTGLMSALTVPSIDVTEILLGAENVSAEKTSDIVKCLSDHNSDGVEPCEMAAIVASPPLTSSEQNITQTMKSDERLRSPVLSPKSSWTSEISNKAEVTSPSLKLCSESIQSPCILKNVEDSEIILCLKATSREGLSDGMTSGVLKRVATAALTMKEPCPTASGKTLFYGTVKVTSVSGQPSSESVQSSCITEAVKATEIAPHVAIIHKAVSGVELDGISSSCSLSHVDLSYNDGQKSESLRTIVALPASAQERVAYIRTPSLDDIIAEVSVVRSPRLSPHDSSGDVSERVSPEHLQVSTSGLLSAQSVSPEDVTEALLVCEDVSTEKTSDIDKCSSDNNVARRELCEMAAIVASPHLTLSGQNFAKTVKSSERLRSPTLSFKSSYISGTSNEIPADDTVECTLLSSKTSTESILSNCMLTDAEHSETSPHMEVSLKTPSGEELPAPDTSERSPSAASKRSLNGITLYDAVEKPCDSTLIASPVCAEPRVACIRTPSLEEISAEVSVVRIRSPRLSPCDSSENVSERASKEHFLVLTPHMSADMWVSEPPVVALFESAEERIDYRTPSLDETSAEVSEVILRSPRLSPQPTLSMEGVSSDIRSDLVKCSSYIDLERKTTEFSTTEASPFITSSGEDKNVSSQSSSERIQFSCISGAKNVPYVVVIHKPPSDLALAEIGSFSSIGHVDLADNYGLPLEKLGSDADVVAPSESTEQRIACIRTPRQDEVCPQVSEGSFRIRSSKLSPWHSSGNVSDRACKDMLAKDTTILSQEKIQLPGLSPIVSEIIDDSFHRQLGETAGLRKACVSASSDFEAEADIHEVAVVEEVHHLLRSSKPDLAESQTDTILAATTASATALLAPSTRVPSKDILVLIPTLSNKRMTSQRLSLTRSPRLSPKSSYVLKSSSPDAPQSICLSSKPSSARCHSEPEIIPEKEITTAERLEFPLSKPSSVKEFQSPVDWVPQISRSSLPQIDKGTHMSRTSLLSISQASQTSRSVLPVAKQESRPSLPSVDQETQMSWTLPQGLDKRTQTSITLVTLSDQGSQMSSVNPQDQSTEKIIPSEVAITEETHDTRKFQLIYQSSSAGNQDDDRKQTAHDISTEGLMGEEAEETLKDKLWTLYHLEHKTDEGLLSTQVLSGPPFNGEAYIRNFGPGSVLLSEWRKKRLKPLSAPIRGRLVSASAFKSGQRPSFLGPSEMVIRPPHPPSSSSFTLPDYVFVVDTDTVNQDSFSSAPETSQAQIKSLAWMSGQY